MSFTSSSGKGRVIMHHSNYHLFLTLDTFVLLIILNVTLPLLLYSDNQRLPFNHRQKVYPNGTFILTDVEKNTDEGLYRCQANGKDGKTASSSLSVSVFIRPEIEPFSFPKSLQEGQRFNVLCSVTKGDEPVTIKWFKDSRLLGRPTSTSSSSSSSSSSMSSSLTSDSNRAAELIGISTVSVTAFSSSLIFDSVRPEHRGNYTCEASNRAGSASVTQAMIVHGKCHSQERLLSCLLVLSFTSFLFSCPATLFSFFLYLPLVLKIRDSIL